MKLHFVLTSFVATSFLSFSLAAQAGKFNNDLPKNMYIDVHHLGAGKVTAKLVDEAHKKDLAIQKKYGVKILKYWFDETKGDVYCLSTAENTESILKTHGDAHGLLPAEFYQVTEGQESIMKGKNNLYLDVHELGEGKVTVADVIVAHQKDLEVQGKY